ncbi:putative membrane protein [Lewinella marina]|uniref:DUF819 domain-containing protein n=1 Tax=Neolewinella marina TaxID=438751 RepID=A0A2G0CGT0_9BACT|nr:DUF819 family protein [Neolewinella marina]NJB86346.1 putative membrane protein [Neolewinella marina]PHK99184.1 hypothetical protein CGL56_06925 [Neolewinella marina]
MITDPLLLLAILCGSVVVSEWLARHTFLRHLGTALVVIIVVAVWANLGFIPSASQGSVVYSGIFRYLAPLAIFYLLLDVNLASVRRAGTAMLGLFVVGSLATAVGVIAGMYVIDGHTHFGGLYPAIAGMFTGTYTGGSVNFNAVAIHYDMMREGVLYAGMTAVDNIITAVWMVVTLAVPMLLRRGRGSRVKTANAGATVHVERETESIGIVSLGLLLAMGFGALFIADRAAGQFAAIGYTVPSILILTSIALVLAQIPWAHRLAGGQLLGLFMVYLFLAVIGAFCELAALGQIGDLAWRLLVLVVVTVGVHGLIIGAAAFLFNIDPDVAAVASQANIGGSSSALALAKSLDRMDLYLPGILVGALGNGLGTYLGFLVAGLLGG